MPNLVAKPFQVTRDYAQMIYDQTLSPRLDKVLRKWEQENWDAVENRQKLAYVILVELLAYQFASPVRWIETQDVLFTRYNFERFIEIGPSPTLTSMATRTLKAKYDCMRLRTTPSVIRAGYIAMPRTRKKFITSSRMNLRSRPRHQQRTPLLLQLLLPSLHLLPLLPVELQASRMCR